MDNQHLNHSNQSGLAAFKASLFFKIIDWCLINTMLFLCITVDTLAYSHSVRAAELPANIELTQLIQIGNSTQTGVKRITRNDFDFTYTLNISYIGDTPIQQVKGHLICLSPSTQIIDADIDFGNLTPGQTLTGKDTYTIRQDRSKPFNPSDLKWSFTYNHPPIAEAGSDQSVPVGAEVILDGVGSTDAEGDSLIYRWTFTARPNDSVAALDNLAAPKSRFIVDRAGRYVVSLIVNDGNQDSTADTVVIDTENSKPVADAGPDQTVATGDTAYLNGSASRDPDGDQLQYKWTLQEAPADSLTELKFADSATPFFTATKAGRYVVHLVVSDGKLDSEADLVIVSTRNSAPVADAGPDQSITLGDPAVTLHGSNSHDVDGQTLTYRWAILSAPDGSTAEINPDNTAEPGFKPELPGLYIMQLIVNDGELDSAADTQQITVASPPPPPNQAPKITTSPHITGTVGQLYTYDVDATDPDISDILGYSLQVAGPGMLIDSFSGLISWTPTEAGDFDVTAKVQDQGGLSDTQNYTLTINAAPPLNRAPQITSTPVTTATVGQLYSYDVDATDPDGDALSYTLTQAPSDMAIDATTGHIRWIPDINNQSQAVVVSVIDSRGSTAEQNFTISVVIANIGPIAVDDSYIADSGDSLSTVALTAQVISVDANWISVNAPLLGDPNLNGYTTFEVAPSDQGSWLKACGDGVPGSSDWRNCTVTGLIPDHDYFIRVSYVDPDGVQGVAQQILGPVHTQATLDNALHVLGAAVSSHDTYLLVKVMTAGDDDLNSNLSGVDIATSANGPWTQKCVTPANGYDHPKLCRVHNKTPNTEYWLSPYLTPTP